MRKYEAYTSISTSWFRHIPEHWNSQPAKRIFSEIGSGTTPKSIVPEYYLGDIPWIQSGDLHHHFLTKTNKQISDIAISECSALKLYKAPFLSLAMYGASIGNLSISQIDAYTNQACCNLANCSENLSYCFYALKSAQGYVISLSAGGTQPNIKQEIVKNLLIPVPPRSEQDQIVRFLDWKVSAINRLIHIKKKEIRAIDTMKRSVVSDVVMHGLDTTVPMKYSGVRWLGDIPAHWSMIKLRQILHPVSVKNHPELPLLSVVREQGVIVRDTEDKEANHNFIPDDLGNYKVVKEGQFAMNKMKAWQGSYGISKYTGIVSPAYFIFDVAFPNVEYFHYAIRSKVYVNFFAQASDGIRVGQWDLQMDKMKEIPFLVPSADEQVAIVEHIKSAILRYETTVEKLSLEIGTLEECKTRLIFDAVTGKIDVRDIEVPEYEYSEEDGGEESDTDGEDRMSEEKFADE